MNSRKHPVNPDRNSPTQHQASYGSARGSFEFRKQYRGIGRTCATYPHADYAV